MPAAADENCWVALGLGVFTIGLVLLLKWNDLRYGNTKGVPPGSMGWPLFGQTLKFYKQGPNFMTKQKSRYVLMYTYLYNIIIPMCAIYARSVDHLAFTHFA